VLSIKSCTTINSQNSIAANGSPTKNSRYFYTLFIEKEQSEEKKVQAVEKFFDFLVIDIRYSCNGISC
jgi:hypothetical protein